MPIDFDQVIDRSRTNSMKWSRPEALLTPEECAAGPLPMWVADMDFKSPEAVLEALGEAVRQGVFGYPAGPTRGYVEAVTGWQRRRFGREVAPEWLVLVPGVITGLKTVIRRSPRPGDTVLVQPPVYVHFHRDPPLLGRQVAGRPWSCAVTGTGSTRTPSQGHPARHRSSSSSPTRTTPPAMSGRRTSCGPWARSASGTAIPVISDEVHQDLS